MNDEINYDEYWNVTFNVTLTGHDLFRLIHCKEEIVELVVEEIVRQVKSQILEKKGGE